MEPELEREKKEGEGNVQGRSELGAKRKCQGTQMSL